MPLFKILILPDEKQVFISENENLLQAAVAAKIPLRASCGGKGVCHTCQIKVKKGKVRLKLNETLKQNEITAPYVLACQAFPLGDLTVEIPETARLTMPQVVTVDSEENSKTHPLLTFSSPFYYPVYLNLSPPSSTIVKDKLSRLLDALKQKTGLEPTQINLKAVQSLALVSRQNNEKVTVFLTEDMGYSTLSLEEVISGHVFKKYYGLAIDIGTTTVAVELLELTEGISLEAKGTYNKQLSYGEDVISRIIYASENENGQKYLQEAIADTINLLIKELATANQIFFTEIKAVVCAGNPTMTHLFLGLDPTGLRLKPYVATANNPPVVRASETGLKIYPPAPVKCVPGITSYLGGDIIAGIVATNMAESDRLTLFVDVGTNGEMVLGNKEWLVSCSCSAGPAFEGSGLKCGTLAIPGAVEYFKITPGGVKVEYTTINQIPPKGICGSGLISCLANLYRSNVIDRRGKFIPELNHPRLRLVNDEKEFVLVWATDTGINKDITISESEISNLIRAKAAIFAGIRSLLQFLDLSLEAIDSLILAGGFGRYLNIKEAIAIGMLPDLPPQKYTYIGNSALKGAKMILLSAETRKKILEIVNKMIYLELSEGNMFMQEFLAALFIPHTNLNLFPSLAKNKQ